MLNIRIANLVVKVNSAAQGAHRLVIGSNLEYGIIPKEITRITLPRPTPYSWIVKAGIVIGYGKKRSITAIVIHFEQLLHVVRAQGVHFG